ncbi:MAG: dihydroneopterin aldolase [Pelobium sp.]
MSKSTHKIGLEGVNFNAAIGYFEEERKFRNDFVVDLFVVFEFSPQQPPTKDLNQTIDYTLLYKICEQFFQIETLLIETVAENILEEIKHRFTFVDEVYLKIKKLNPPLKASIANSFIEVNYQK